MNCQGCPPHAIHYGACYNFNDFKPRCECKVEEPPLPFLGAETAAERGYEADDQHEDWLVFGESRDSMYRERER